ncbi:hypothetical protein AZE42_09143 [Rhizopogon vesiculosus]|uniref:Uncharacterized protein n=1 Tax=Rhizopogon vesiculosus TaxID=180088 RepID=A0A1J8PGW5_9AGAM|nr:hypothetical protein AZE42_09143 [Rhizopogon vesiculosus]
MNVHGAETSSYDYDADGFHDSDEEDENNSYVAPDHSSHDDIAMEFGDDLRIPGDGRGIAFVVEFLKDGDTLALRSPHHMSSKSTILVTHLSDPYDASSPVHHPHLRPQSSSYPQYTMPGLDMPS